MAKKYSKIYNADVQIFKVLNLSSQDGDAEDNFDCKNMNIYFKYEFCEVSLCFLTVQTISILNMQLSVKLEIELD